MQKNVGETKVYVGNITNVRIHVSNKRGHFAFPSASSLYETYLKVSLMEISACS